MCWKIRCDEESWKLFGFQGEALFSSLKILQNFLDSPSESPSLVLVINDTKLLMSCF